MRYSNIMIVACTAASFSLSAQPDIDIILLTAPSNTETVGQSALLTTWSPPAEGDVWVLPPNGIKFLANSNTLAGSVEKIGPGVFSLYFPKAGLGLRTDLIVE